MEDLYVDDLSTGREKTTDVKNSRCTRHSYKNIQRSRICLAQVPITFFWTSKKIIPKVQLNKTGQKIMSGIKWDKKKDKVNIKIPLPIQKITKRNILQKLASIYHVLGFISPCTLEKKHVFCKICDKKIPWARDLPPDITKIWLNSRKKFYQHMLRYQDLSPVFKRKSDKKSFTYLGMQA